MRDLHDDNDNDDDNDIYDDDDEECDLITLAIPGPFAFGRSPI